MKGHCASQALATIRTLKSGDADLSEAIHILRQAYFSAAAGDQVSSTNKSLTEARN
jgi:hypothetical protein